MQRVTLIVGYTGSQYPIFDCLQQIATQIAQDNRPQTVDTPYTLISMMRQTAGLSIF